MAAALPAVPPAFHPDQLVLAESDRADEWFAVLTAHKLRRSAHCSVTELETDVRKWIASLCMSAKWAWLEPQ